MLGQMIGQMRHKGAHPRHQAKDGENGVMRHRELIIESITAHDALSRLGLWGMLIFIVISGLALQLRTVDLFADLPAGIRDVLGDPPPPELIHVVLAVSTLSSIIIILGRAMADESPGGTWGKLWAGICFRSIFYFFYATANVLEENFLIVFVAGIVVLALEHFTTWHYAARVIEREKHELARIN